MDTSPNTLFVGKVLHQFPELESTNSYAIDILSKSKPSEGTIILAEDQKMGRGQIGRFWESQAKKNLTLSIILYPSFLPARQQFELNQAVSLAVFDLVSHFIPREVYVKWSNDIYVKDKKIAGILIQNVLSGYTIQSSVIGIGLNINQRIFLSNAPNPTSLALETGQDFDLNSIFHLLCQKIEQRYLQLRRGQSNILQKNYLQHLYRIEKPHFYQRIADQSVFQGTIKGISPIGKLVVEIDGQEEAFEIREIKFLH